MACATVSVVCRPLFSSLLAIALSSNYPTSIRWVPPMSLDSTPWASDVMRQSPANSFVTFDEPQVPACRIECRLRKKEPPAAFSAGAEGGCTCESSKIKCLPNFRGLPIHRKSSVMGPWIGFRTCGLPIPHGKAGGGEDRQGQSRVNPWPLVSFAAISERSGDSPMDLHRESSPPVKIFQHLPLISCVVQQSGPIVGGTAVFVLGSNFTPKHKIVFGETVATTIWCSREKLVCVAPPALKPGVVVLSIEGSPTGDGHGREPYHFEYKGFVMDDLEDIASLLPSGGDVSDYLQSLWDTCPSASPPSVGHQGHLENIIRRLIVRLRDCDALRCSGSTDALKLTTKSRKNLLHLTSALGFGDLCVDLIEYGIPINERDANGFTALHFAAFYGRTTCARDLVNHGADTEIVDVRSRTALEIAIWRGAVDALL